MSRVEIIGLGIVIGGLIALLPIWTSGLRRGLTFFDFVRAHTVFDPKPVTYVPEELYTQPLTRDELNELLVLHQAEEIVALPEGQQ